MQTKIQIIGDGFGLLVPKELLDACGIGEEATVIVQNRTLIVAAPDWPARQGWAEASRAIPQDELDRDHEQLRAFRETPHEWDDKEWQWPEPPGDEKV